MQIYPEMLEPLCTTLLGFYLFLLIDNSRAALVIQHDLVRKPVGGEQVSLRGTKKDPAAEGRLQPCLQTTVLPVSVTLFVWSRPKRMKTHFPTETNQRGSNKCLQGQHASAEP